MVIKLKNRHIKLSVLILILLALIFPSFAQNVSLGDDTTLASIYYIQADSLRFLDENEAAIPLYKKAASIYLTSGGDDRFWMAFHARLNLLIELRDERAGALADSLETVLPSIKEKYPPPHSILMHSFNNLGYYYSSRQDYHKSVLFFEELFQVGVSMGFPSQRFSIQAAMRFSRPLIHTDQFDKAFSLMFKAEEALDAKEPFCDCEDLRKGLYSTIGGIYLRRNYYVNTKIYFERALEEDRKRGGNSESENGGLYLNLAAVTKELYELEKSRQYGEEALRLLEKKYGENHLYMAYAYNNLGNTLKDLKEYKEAERCQLKSMRIREQLYGSSHISLADPLQNLGSLYLEMKRYEDAIVYATQAKDLWIRHYGPQHSALVRIYLLMAYAHEELGDLSASLQYADKAILLVQSKERVPTESYASVLRQKALLLRKVGQLEASLDLYQQAIIQNHETFSDRDWHVNPPLNKSKNLSHVRTYQAGKGRSLFLLYQQKKNLDLLRLSAACFQLANKAVDSLRRSTQVETDLLTLSKKSHTMFQWAIETEAHLYEVLGEEKHLEQAFVYAEKSRAISLETALQAENAKISAGLPSHLQEKEEQLLADLAYTKEQINYWEEAGDSLQVVANKAYAFSLTTRYDSLLDYYQEKLPTYYALRFQAKSASLSKTQQALPLNTALLIYAQGESELFAFVINREKAEVYRLNWDQQGEAFLQDFLRDLRDPVQALKSENDPAAITAFEAKAHRLYQELLAPLAFENHGSLWLVPDGLLSYLPFELLIKEKSATALSSFRDLDYLFRSQNLRYAFSASLALEEKTSQGKSHTSTYLGFAPQYESKEFLLASLRGIDEDMPTRDSWSNLRSNQPEIKQVADLWRGKAVLGTAATEGMFKKEASEYDILHLAMHAFTNDQKPAYSGLVFATDADSTEDQILYAYEIAHLNLQAELAVLSACNTGTGSLAKGEGVMSLARAFRYAGCRNLLTSLWQTEDQAAAQLVNDFFMQLRQELPKSEALRQARLAYLEKGRHPHPYFWAPFVLIGNDQPMKKGGSFLFLKVLSLIALVGFFSFLVTKMKKS